jgi:acetyl-CoA carboxylase biotin carboxyl carrier protein
MQLSDLTQLVKLLDKSNLTEISFSDEKSKIVLKKEPPRLPTPLPMAAAPAPVYAPAPSASVPAVAGASQAAAEKSGSKFKEITSPMVGTFFAASTPGSAPFVQVGSAVKPGQVLCIIEAMKIMNEIESDVSGVVEEVCVPNETPVEYGTVLFRVRPA